MIDILIDDAVKSGMTSVIPPEQAIEQAVQTTVQVVNLPVEQIDLCIRFADNDAVQTLNSTWRQKNSVTDVLSFPMQEVDALDLSESLGDIILALPFVQQEAVRLERQPHEHTLHLIIHGTLHLLGYDHIEDDDAAIMQPLECAIMQQLHLYNPYPDLTASHV